MLFPALQSADYDAGGLLLLTATFRCKIIQMKASQSCMCFYGAGMSSL